jgi:hypothetical protein
MYTLLRHGKDPLLGEQKLLHWAFSCGMCTERSIALEARAIERGHSALAEKLARDLLEPAA